jgi:hypothetical protein
VDDGSRIGVAGSADHRAGQVMEALYHWESNIPLACVFAEV